MPISQNETLKGSIAQSDSLAGSINGRQSMSGVVIPRGVDGVSPEIEVTEIEGGNRLTIKDIGGTKTVDIMDGEKGDKGDTGSPGSKGDTGSPGKDGYTPVKGVDYFDGEDGAPGKNGVSPAVSVTTISGGHRVTIVDANGTKTFDVLDGEDGTMSFEDLTPAQKESLKGDDGYTPVKGVDYFDGKDGKDGYTPVKGKDYFDGKDGSDGSDGSDGVSATHSWNGTTLTITSASGTSSANLKGAKGDKGDSGDPGVSPSVSVDAIDGGHRVTVTDAIGTHIFDVLDGVDTVEPLIVTADQHFFTSHTAQEIVDAKNEGKMVILNAGIVFVDMVADNADDGTVAYVEFSKLMYYNGRPAIMKVTITGNVGVPTLSQIDAAAVGAAQSDHSHENLSINGTTYNGGSDVDFTSVIEAMISAATASNPSVQIKTGTYTGTGTYGSANKNTLDFGFKPLFIFVAKTSFAGTENTTTSKFNMKYAQMFATNGQGSVIVHTSWDDTYSSDTHMATSPFFNTLTWTTTGVSWYASNNQGVQLNQASQTYRYFAIG
jgi:hypothetical protein